MIKDCNGYNGSYSSYLVIDVKLRDLFKTLDEINSTMRVVSFIVTKRGIHFEICKESPELIHSITGILKCRGYAHVGAWYGNAHFVASINGDETNSTFTAAWCNGCPDREYKTDGSEEIPDQEAIWDAHVKITDRDSGEVFYTGDGAIDYDQMLYWKDFVENH